MLNKKSSTKFIEISQTWKIDINNLPKDVRDAIESNRDMGMIMLVGWLRDNVSKMSEPPIVVKKCPLNKHMEGDTFEI